LGLLDAEVEDNAMEAGAASVDGHIQGILTHGGQYVQYNIFGNLFEVSSKYIPPYDLSAAAHMALSAQQ
jgi:hypothetical protein